LEIPTIRKLAVYEPAFFAAGLPSVFLARFQKEMARGNIAAAFTAAARAVKIRPIPKYVPDWLLTFFTRQMMANQDKRQKGDYLTLQQLTEALQYDFRLVIETHGRLSSFRALQTSVLLLGGEKSPQYLRDDLAALGQVFPHVTRLTFPELNHSGPWNCDAERNATGNPNEVARELRCFFLAESIQVMVPGEPLIRFGVKGDGPLGTGSHQAPGHYQPAQHSEAAVDLVRFLSWE
jgi:hypothetical protein